jgi:hypothetical protein
VSPPIAPTPPTPVRATPSVIKLTLSDFLPRIPEAYLQSGPHDCSAPLEFDARVIGDAIAKGCTTIPLAQIHRRLPGIFRKAIADDDPTEIRFPWEKLLVLTKMARAGAEGAFPLSTVEILGKKLRSFRTANRAGGAAPETSETQARNDGPNGAPWYTKKGQPLPAPGPAPGPALQLLPTPDSASDVLDPAPAPEIKTAPSAPLPPTTPAPVNRSEATRPAPQIPAQRAAPPPQSPAAEPPRPSAAASEEVAALREQLAKEYAQCRQEQEKQLAVLAGDREALRKQLEETLGNLQRAREEIEEKTREPDADTTGARETTQSMSEARNAQALEVENLLAAGELRISVAEQERTILLRLREHLQETVKQLGLARSDFAKLNADFQLKTREFSALEELALNTEQQLAARSAERDALLLECAASKSEGATAHHELEALRETNTASELAASDLRQRLDASATREAELAAALANEQEGRQRAERLSRQARADAESSLAALRDESESQQSAREAAFQEETGRLAARIEELLAAGTQATNERLRLVTELAELHAANSLAQSPANLQAAIHQQRHKIQRLRRQGKADAQAQAKLAASLAQQQRGAALARKQKAARALQLASAQTASSLQPSQKKGLWKRLLGS